MKNDICYRKIEQTFFKILLITIANNFPKNFSKKKI